MLKEKNKLEKKKTSCRLYLFVKKGLIKKIMFTKNNNEKNKKNAFVSKIIKNVLNVRYIYSVLLLFIILNSSAGCTLGRHFSIQVKPVIQLFHMPGVIQGPYAALFSYPYFIHTLHHSTAKLDENFKFHKNKRVVVYLHCWWENHPSYPCQHGCLTFHACCVMLKSQTLNDD